ncbi:MAG: cell envelope biogenesis protein OmpA, partial [Leeuwenhoekiella sp.]
MRTYLFVISLCFTAFGFGQKTLKEANKLYDRAIYIEAASKYEAYLKDTEEVQPEVWLNIADTYYNLDDINQAKTAYDKAYSTLSFEIPERHFWQYCDAIRYQGNYEKADELYLGYLKKNGNPERVKKYTDDKKAFSEVKDKMPDITIENLDFNSEYADFGGSFNENDFIFSSARKQDYGEVYERDNTPFLSLYKIADYTAENITADNVQLFDENLETIYHDATATFSPRGEYFYYASSYQKDDKRVFTGKKKNFFKIYRVRATIKPYVKEELPFNGNTFSTGQPYVTK